MNERIRELAEQANAWYPDGYPSPEGGDEAWENVVIFEKQDLEKFAELIAVECATITSKKAASIAEKAELYAEDDDEKTTALATAWQITVLEAEILKHFGLTK